MIHGKQWHYSLHRDFQQLHSIHSTRRNPRDSSSTNSTFRRQKSSSSNSTYRRQGDLLSSLQRPTRHSSSTRTFQTFQSFMTFSPTRHYYMFQHPPVQSSTFQCYPVHPGIPPVPAFLQSECLFYTPIGFHQKLH